MIALSPGNSMSRNFAGDERWRRRGRLEKGDAQAVANDLPAERHLSRHQGQQGLRYEAQRGLNLPQDILKAQEIGRQGKRSTQGNSDVGVRDTPPRHAGPPRWTIGIRPADFGSNGPRSISCPAVARVLMDSGNAVARGLVTTAP